MVQISKTWREFSPKINKRHVSSIRQCRVTDTFVNDVHDVPPSDLMSNVVFFRKCIFWQLLAVDTMTDNMGKILLT